MSCPFGFGELNIPSSRAFWDDCEEDEIPSTEPEKYLNIYFYNKKPHQSSFEKP